MDSVHGRRDRDPMKILLDKKKGLIVKEFEKVCPTESSLRRMIKELHNIFDDLYTEVIEHKD